MCLFSSGAQRDFNTVSLSNTHKKNMLKLLRLYEWDFNTCKQTVEQQFRFPFYFYLKPGPSTEPLERSQTRLPRTEPERGVRQFYEKQKELQWKLKGWCMNLDAMKTISCAGSTNIHWLETLLFNSSSSTVFSRIFFSLQNYWNLHYWAEFWMFTLTYSPKTAVPQLHRDVTISLKTQTVCAKAH